MPIGSPRPTAGRKAGGKNKTTANRTRRCAYAASEEEFAKITENAKRASKSLQNFVRDRALMD